MNDTILGIVIGGVLTMIPTLYNSWLSRRDHHDQRMHELRLKRYDSIAAPNIDAIMNYAEKLGACISAFKPRSSQTDHADLLREYFTAYERLYPYVSMQTRRAMEAIENPCEFEIGDREIITLNACLGDELSNALDDATYPACERDQKCLYPNRSKLKNRIRPFFVPIKDIFSACFVHRVDNDDENNP